MSESNPIQALSEQFTALQEDNRELKESLSQVQAMMAYEDRGWELLKGGDTDLPGPDLEDAKQNALKCRHMAVGNALIKRGLTLRYNFVWGKGVDIPGVQQNPGKPGPKSVFDKFYRNRINQQTLFSDEAHQNMEFALGTDGVFLALGDDKSKEVRVFPLEEVSGIVTNPDFTGEVWAIQRQWTSIDTDGGRTTEKKWYYVDTYTGKRGASFGDGGNRVEVDKGKTLFAAWANRQVGWPLGTPDALPAVPWARRYTELMEYGRIQTEALAKFSMKVTGAKSKAGSQAFGVTVSNTAGAGNVASLGLGNDLVPLTSATKAYDFGALRPVAASAASALEVSIVHLLSDPSASGSSYGASETLAGPQKKAMAARQNLWADFLGRIIEWATGETVIVSFPGIDDPDPYREMQRLTLPWSSGLFYEDEMRARMAKAADIELLHRTPPAGVLLPNNEDSLPRQDIDTDTSGIPITAPSPDQGQSNGTGGGGSTAANDLRDDTVS